MREFGEQMCSLYPFNINASTGTVAAANYIGFIEKCIALFVFSLLDLQMPFDCCFCAILCKSSSFSGITSPLYCYWCLQLSDVFQSAVTAKPT